MSAHDPATEEAARLWALRIHDADFDEWDRFTEWLEQGPDNLAAYETALAEDAWAAELLHTRPMALPQPLAPRPRRSWWFAGGGAIAASVAAAVVVLGLGERPAGMQQVATAVGEHRTIELADGSRVLLNGNTRVTFDASAPRRITLGSGEALFEVRHDATHPFVVSVGKTQLLDAGTKFNVVREGQAIDVAVAEGAVVFEPGPEEIRLGAGDAISRVRDGSAPVLRRANLEAIGSWQSGELHYTNASLDQVARDLGRNLGRPVRVAHGVARIRFTGTIILRGAPGEVLARAGPLLGVEFALNAEGWTMSPADGPLR